MSNPNFEMSAERLIAASMSRPGPLDDETWRSGFNFSTSLVDHAVSHFLAKINPYNPKWDSIRFSIARHVVGGRDETIHENVSSGQTITAYRDDSLYIGNPQGADAKFTVEFYEVR